MLYIANIRYIDFEGLEQMKHMGEIGKGLKRKVD
jgi:hypothetical protein